MKFELIGRIEKIEIIAGGGRIHDLPKLRKKHGKGRWRKLKGIGRVRCLTVTNATLSCTGMKRTELVRRK